MENKQTVRIGNIVYFLKVVVFALKEGLILELINKLYYLFNYGSDPHLMQHTVVNLYADNSSGKNSFVATVDRIVPNESYTDYTTRRLIVIGLVYRSDKRVWECHS